jgi:enoyl reductase
MPTARAVPLREDHFTEKTSVGLHLDAGTPDADLYPASGDCALNGNGSIGKAYQHGYGNSVPPCGLTYRRSSGQGTFSLSATLTWQVSWVGSGGTGGQLANGVFDMAQPVTVREVQAINR